MQTSVNPDPLPLPSSREELLAKRKIPVITNLNDEVERIFQIAYPEDERLNGGRGKSYLYATYDSQAVEGSLSADNIFAALVIREKATELDSFVAGETCATISKALGVVLRRYGEDRKTRKNTVHGERVPNDNGDDRDN